MNKRRKFIKDLGLMGVSIPFLDDSFYSKDFDFEAFYQQAVLPEPNDAQKQFMDLKFGMFIHFGINTFYDKEWSDGTLDQSAYNPENLDTDQWCRVASEAGMKYVVFVAKHHSGFCNWPTKQTKYNAYETPFNGDLVGRVVNSAQKFGLKTGLYYSLWDRNQILHDEDEHRYIHEFLIPQLEELLTNYGEIIEIWFDGFWKKQTSGWKTNNSWSDLESFVRAWRYEGAFRWQIDYIYQYVKNIQPNCIVMNNPTSKFKGVPLHPVDAVCAERGTNLETYKKVWNWLGKDKFFPLQIETTMSVRGNHKFPNGNWFWHEWDHSVLTKSEIKHYLAQTEKLGANLLLNCGPMANGRLRPEDVKVLTTL